VTVQEPGLRILGSLAWWRAAGVPQPTRHQVAFVAGYTVNGHFTNQLGALRSKGFIDYPGTGVVSLTAAGEARVPAVAEVPTRAELIARVRSILREEPRRRLFDVLVQVGSTTRAHLARAAGYTVNGHFTNVLGSLRSLGVVDYPGTGLVALSSLFEALA
jgi:hypothetical protein